eukprot:1798057-Rhodomonas_salina.3
MPLFSWPEDFRALHLSDNCAPGRAPSCSLPVKGGLSLNQLRLGVCVETGAVLRATIIAHPIQLCGVANDFVEKNRTQLLIRDQSRVEGQKHRFGVACELIAHILVGWMGLRALCVADQCF